MKKILVFLTFFSFLILNNNLFASSNSLDGKIGGAYGADAEKFGFQIGFTYYKELDKYFSLGIQPSLCWTKWDETVGSETVGGGSGVNVDKKANTNAYMIPVLGVAQVKFANFENSLKIVPYVNIGLGYSILAFNYSQPSYTDNNGNPVSAESDTDLYHGFTWEFVGGISFKLAEDSLVNFLLEAGYRGAKLKNGDIELDMSGVMANIGVKYPF